MRHLLITGKPRSGKTELIKKAASLISSPAGFFTQEILKEGKRFGFTAKSFSGETILFASQKEDFSHEYRSYRVDVKGFENFLQRTLVYGEKQRFVVIDEIGRMEILSGVFRGKIREFLDSSKRMLGTISLSSDRFLAEVKSRDDVYILNLNSIGRGECFAFIKEWLRSYTRREVQAMDRIASYIFGIKGEILMENAGRSVAEEVYKIFRKYKAPVVVFCGKGNNGADGLVCARHLLSMGVDVRVFLVDNRKGSPLSSMQKAVLEKMDTNVFLEEKELARLSSQFIAVDAIFGIGFRGKVEMPFKKYIGIINKRSLFRVSVDTPSGLDADLGYTQDNTVEADLTITFLGKKVGFLETRARKSCGRVKVVNLGINSAFLEKHLSR